MSKVTIPIPSRVSKQNLGWDEETLVRYEKDLNHLVREVFVWGGNFPFPRYFFVDHRGDDFWEELRTSVSSDWDSLLIDLGLRCDYELKRWIRSQEEGKTTSIGEVVELFQNLRSSVERLERVDWTPILGWMDSYSWVDDERWRWSPSPVCEG